MLLFKYVVYVAFCAMKLFAYTGAQIVPIAYLLLENTLWS